MTVTGDDLRQAMGQFATGVTVILVENPEGGDNAVLGMTANAITSVSLDPPQILICVAKQRTIYEPLNQAGRFSVSILSQEQETVSQYFAGQREPDFEKDISYLELPGGLPGLEGALAWLEAQVTAVHPGGDHDIFVAQVVSATSAPEARSGEEVAGRQATALPLLFFNSRYAKLQT